MSAGRPAAVGHEGSEKFAIVGALLGRLHTLPSDGSVSRPGGASGDDPKSEGSPRQDPLAALASSCTPRITRSEARTGQWRSTSRG